MHAHRDNFSYSFPVTESCDADQRVPVGSACNGVTDCVDDSDEFGCGKLIISPFLSIVIGVR